MIVKNLLIKKMWVAGIQNKNCQRQRHWNQPWVLSQSVNLWWAVWLELVISEQDTELRHVISALLAHFNFIKSISEAGENPISSAMNLDVINELECNQKAELPGQLGI